LPQDGAEPRKTTAASTRIRRICNGFVGGSGRHGYRSRSISQASTFEHELDELVEQERTNHNGRWFKAAAGPTIGASNDRRRRARRSSVRIQTMERRKFKQCPENF